MLNKPIADTPVDGPLTDGMTVFASDGDKLGTVRNYNPRDGYLDVRKGWLFTKDIYVPVTAIAYVEHDALVLGMAKATLEDTGYAMPPANVGFGSAGQGIARDTGTTGAEQPAPVIRSDGSLVGTGAVRSLPDLEHEIDRVTADHSKPDAPAVADDLGEDQGFRIR